MLGAEATDSPFHRFRNLAKRLVSVPRDEARAEKDRQPRKLTRGRSKQMFVGRGKVT